LHKDITEERGTKSDRLNVLGAGHAEANMASAASRNAVPVYQIEETGLLNPESSVLVNTRLKCVFMSSLIPGNSFSLVDLGTLLYFSNLI
jgi:hypothetical protein